MTLQPIGNQILVTMTSQQLSSGLVLPDDKGEFYALVDAVGEDVKGIAVGDKLIADMRAAIRIGDGGKQLLVPASDVKGKYV